jgi:ubiquinone/menaquinone biosynthesis C-methylase UbiE
MAIAFLKTLSNLSRRLLRREMAPAPAYDRWAPTYDAQPDNLMLALDEQIFTRLLNTISCTGKLVLDIGCGTGRHWDKVLAHAPQKIRGFDVSAGMLHRLQQKYPQADTQLIVRDRYNFLGAETAGVLICTLTLAHIRNPESAMQQWKAMLQPGADILLTDYHPETLSLGGDRTFSYQGKTTAIRNYVHPLEKVKQMAGKNGFELVAFDERRIGPALKPWYEKQGALEVYARFAGAGIIYGMHLRKKHAAA